MSFFEKAISWAKRLFGKAPKFTTSAKSALLQLSPLVIGLEAIISPEAIGPTEDVISKIQQGLGAVGAVLDGAGDMATLPTILASVKDHIGELEGALQIKNPDTQAKVTGITKAISAELDAIAAAIPALKATAS